MDAKTFKAEDVAKNLKAANIPDGVVEALVAALTPAETKPETFDDKKKALDEIKAQEEKLAQQEKDAGDDKAKLEEIAKQKAALEEQK